MMVSRTMTRVINGAWPPIGDTFYLLDYQTTRPRGQLQENVLDCLGAASCVPTLGSWCDLRQTRVPYPIRQEPIETSSPSPLPPPILGLVRDLVNTGNDKTAIIPDIYLQGVIPLHVAQQPKH